MKFWTQNNFWSKKLLIQEEFWSKIIFGPNNLYPKSLGLTKFCPKKFSTPKTLCQESLVKIGSDIDAMEKYYQDKCHPDVWYLVKLAEEA